jgi:hypothetical protein
LQELDTVLTNALDKIEAQTQSVSSGHFQLAIPLTTISHIFTSDLECFADDSRATNVGFVRFAGVFRMHFRSIILPASWAITQRAARAQTTGGHCDDCG